MPASRSSLRRQETSKSLGLDDKCATNKNLYTDRERVEARVVPHSSLHIASGLWYVEAGVRHNTSFPTFPIRVQDCFVTHLPSSQNDLEATCLLRLLRLASTHHPDQFCFCETGAAIAEMLKYNSTLHLRLIWMMHAGKSNPSFM